MLSFFCYAAACAAGESVSFSSVPKMARRSESPCFRFA